MPHGLLGEMAHSRPGSRKIRMYLDHLIFPQRKDVLRKPQYGIYGRHTGDKLKWPPKAKVRTIRETK